MSKEFTQRCEAVGLKEGSLFTWLEKVETLQAENAALKEQVAQLEFRNERLVADYAELQGLNENHAFNAKYFKAENKALKQQVEQGKRDAIPEGWCFYHADFSMQAGGKSETGTVSFIRDMAGRKWWHSLSEERQEDTPLYIYGNGATIQEAIDAAIAAAQNQEK